MTSWRWQGFREGCGTCVHWLRQGETDFGTCKRYPPTLIPVKDHNPQGMDYTQIQQHLPTMSEQDWCGEYQRSGA